MRFNQRKEIIIQICNYPEKFLSILEANLTQDLLDTIEHETIVPLSVQETADLIYDIGNKVKRIGVDQFAQVIGLDPTALSNAMDVGTAKADALLAAIEPAPTPTPEEPTTPPVEPAPSEPTPPA